MKNKDRLVYCCHCEFFHGSHGGYNNENNGICNALDNTGTWYSPNVKNQKPWETNQNNDCKWFEAARK